LDNLNSVIREIDEENEKREEQARKQDRDFEIKEMKIQIYAEKSHAVLSATLSFILVVFGLVVIFYPLYIQATLEGNPFSATGILGLSGTLLLLGFTVFYLRRYVSKYNSDFKRISDFTDSLRKSDAFPSLIDMDKKK
jgi:membrane-bound ClpP family serine protease